MPSRYSNQSDSFVELELHLQIREVDSLGPVFRGDVPDSLQGLYRMPLLFYLVCWVKIDIHLSDVTADCVDVYTTAKRHVVVLRLEAGELPRPEFQRSQHMLG